MNGDLGICICSLTNFLLTNSATVQCRFTLLKSTELNCHRFSGTQNRVCKRSFTWKTSGSVYGIEAALTTMATASNASVLLLFMSHLITNNNRLRVASTLRSSVRHLNNSSVALRQLYMAAPCVPSDKYGIYCQLLVAIGMSFSRSL